MIFLPIDRRKDREGKEGEAEYSRLHSDATKAASGSIEAGGVCMRVCVWHGVHDTVSVVPVSSHSASSRIIHEKK